MNEKILPHDWYPRPVPDNVEIGARSWLYSAYAFLHYRSRRPYGLRVGEDSGVYNGTMFELGPDAEVEIGDYTAVVGAIFATNGRVSIGNYAFIAHQVFIADGAVAVPPPAFDALPSAVSARPIVIGDDVWIGARAVILGGVTIGEGSIVGAATVVREDVPSYSVVAGNPARIVKSLRR